jgi:hypothetical protein
LKQQQPNVNPYLLGKTNNIRRLFMHRKAVFALAGVFLAIALVVPPVLFIIQADNDLDNYLVIQNNQGLVTSGNATIIDQAGENHTNTIIISAVIEVVFIPAFAVTLFYGVNHPHPHGKEVETEDSEPKPNGSALET